MVVHTCKLQTWEVETRINWGFKVILYILSLWLVWATQDPVLKWRDNKPRMMCKEERSSEHDLLSIGEVSEWQTHSRRSQRSNVHRGERRWEGRWKHLQTWSKKPALSSSQERLTSFGVCVSPKSLGFGHFLWQQRAQPKKRV